MLTSKRKRQSQDESDEESVAGPSRLSDDEDEIDISSALVSGGRPANAELEANSDDDNEDALNELIASSIAKRNIKSGTELLKKVKGKGKMIKGEVGGGSFQSMGLHPSLLRSLTLQGFRIPTPIQRLAIPLLLANPPRDLVGMARTGSGKSLAYMIPLAQRLGGRHSTAFGARALIMLPTRELALQVLKVGKELTRGWQGGGQSDHAGDSRDNEDGKKGQSLRWGMIVGGEGLDEQFEMMTSNPDVIIATPGRLLHLLVEMNLDLKSIQYVVFDEADRLFEMGFETALTEIIQRLPTTRQTLLFSATLPKSLVEFAKAGLQDPKLVRLDAESKISSDLKMAFFSVKQAEKDACLLSLLRDVIKVPLGKPEGEGKGEDNGPDRKKKKFHHMERVTAPHQTLVFAATKHHVEYLQNLLTTAGYAVSHIYGSLDQAARTHQMDLFRRGMTSILVVTDVAARGIDIPVLENVVNFDFPQGARVFVHRVGRTARAGRQGWAWSFVTNTELPYLLDLQLFLGRPLKSDTTEDGDHVYTENLILGTFPREQIDEDVEYARSLEDVNHSLPSLREVMKRGHAMYERSKGKASPASYKRAKEMTKSRKWMLAGSESGIHPVLLRGSDAAEKRKAEEARQALLRTVNSFQPSETVFEIGTKGNAATAALMKDRRKALSKSRSRIVPALSSAAIDEDMDAGATPRGEMEMADEEDIMSAFKSEPTNYRDSEFYMSHYQKDALTEKGYSLTDGASFVEQARGATFDLAGDEGAADKKRRQLTWDKKKKKFIQGGGVGADNVKLVKTESGTKLPATYRSGRFDEWKAKTRTDLPRTGEAENDTTSRWQHGRGGKRFKHNKTVEAKPLDKLSKDYDRKVRQIKKKQAAGGEDTQTSSRPTGRKVAPGRIKGKSVSRVKNELKTVDQIRKHRKVADNRKAKNSRPSKKGRR
ncbi:DEAD-domain-containing protein [Pleurotus eryngii]|uniref:RNA helicase n=1 Tax=Pleurotus eryngii TaxID=5323 RepID=A0A9P6DK71_PLEER|nr:DEAD-domain-containing protein [Pleurotus eryngii]